MENQLQNANLPISGSRSNEASAAFGVSAQGSASTVGNPNPPQNIASLGSSQPNPPTQPRSPSPRPPRGRRSVWVVRIGIIVVLLLGVAGIFLLLRGTRQQVTSSQGSSITQRYDNLSIPLSEFAKAGSIALESTRTLSINGQLRVNNGVIISPTVKPVTAVAGQLYFDQATNQLGYYNGSQFVDLLGASQTVQSIGGSSGAIALGAGLSQSGNQLSNSGVLSLQGQTGAVTLVAGPGITISGTTLSSSGVLSLGGQTGDITLGSGLSISNGQLKNSGVVSVASSSATITVTNDGNGNITLGSTGAGSGTVQSPGGTAGRIAKFTGVQTIADSLLSESGSTVTVGGDLSVTGSLTLGTALAVTSGGTGAATLTANGVLIGNGTSAISSIVAGAPGQCLLSTAGAPSWQACPGGGTGVTSLDSLTGALTLANSSGVGTTVTIDDASTSAKGIAQFNSTNFSVSGGVVNTIQNINTAAAPTFGQLTLTSSQASAAMLTVNNTNVAATGNLVDLQLNGSSRFSVSPAGALTLSSTINGQTISSTASFTGTLGVTGLASLNGGATVTGTLTANTITPSSSLTVGATGQSFTLQGNASSTLTATNAGSTTTVAFQTPTANVTYRLLTAAAGTYDICTTVGNCAGVGGGVTTAGGTTNKIAKFTGSQAIGDSILTDDGSTVTIGGTLAVNTLTPTGALTIGATGQNLTLQGAATTLSATSGGITNSLTFATPATSNKTITIPNASGTVAVSAGGPLSLDVNGNLTCPTCVTGTAVSSLDGLTGALTLANSTGAGATITIDNASTSAKGIAQFNSTNFTASSGTINTIQDIATTSAPTFGQLTLTSSQASAAMLTVNNTNVSASGNLVDLQLNGSSRFSVSPAGALTLSSTINGQTISSTASFTGTLGVTGLASLNGGATVTGTLTANTITPSSALTVGATSQSFTLQGNASSTLTATNAGSTTTVAFQTPTANVTYRFLTTTAGTYDICTTAGNCSGVGGGVTTPGGTTNKIAKFTASQTIADSIITDNGSTVTIGGVLAVNTLTPSAALTLGATTQAFTLQGTSTSVITATSGANTTTLSFTTPTAARAVALPDESGTICLQNSTSCGFATSSGSGNYIQNTTTVQTNANIAVQSVADASVTVLIKERASQSADLLRIVDSANAAIFNVDSFGKAHFAQATDVATYLAVGTASDSGITLKTQNTSTTQIGLQIDASNSSQTGDITQLLGPSSRRIVYDATGTLAIRGGTIQSTDLLQFQNSAGDVLSKFGSTGQLTLGRIAAAGTTQAGSVTFADGTNSNFGATLNTTTLTANRTISLPDAAGTVCLQSSTACGFALSSGSGNYIQNQSASDQTADFRISGTGRANTSVQTPLLDTATAAILNIGTTNATAINLNKGTTITGALTQSGGAISLTANATSTIGTTTGTLTVQSNTSANQIVLGSSNTIDFNTGGSGTITVGSSNTTTVNIGALTNNARTVNVGVGTGGTQTQTVNVGSTGGASVTTIQGGTGNIKLVGSATTLVKPTANSATAFQVQPTASTTSVLDVDTTNNRVGINTNAPGYALDVAGSINVTTGNTYKINGTDICTSSGCTPAAGSSNYIQNISGVIGQNANIYITSAVSSQAVARFQSPLGGTGDLIQLANGIGTVMFNVDSTGVLTHKPTNDGTIFQVQTAGGTNQLSVDSSNKRVILGTSGGDTNGTILVLGTKTNSGDPTGVVGSMYYSNVTQTIRCYEGYRGWVDCVGQPKPNSRRSSYLLVQGGTATTMDRHGDIDTAGTAATAQAATTSEPATLNYATTASSNSFNNVYGNANYNSSAKPDFQTYASITSTSSVRFWAGMTDQASGSFQGTATPNGNYAAFRFDTSAGDTTVKCYTKNNLITNNADSGVAPGTTGHKYEIIIIPGTRVQFKIDGVEVCNITNFIPSSNVLMRYELSITTLTTAINNMRVGWVYVESDL